MLEPTENTVAESAGDDAPEKEQKQILLKEQERCWECFYGTHRS